MCNILWSYFLVVNETSNAIPYWHGDEKTQSSRKDEFISANNPHLVCIPFLCNEIIEKMNQSDASKMRAEAWPLQKLQWMLLFAQNRDNESIKNFFCHLNLYRSVVKDTLQKENIDSHYPISSN